MRTLDKYKLPWVVAIRSNHGVWLTPQQRVRANKWCKFKRTFSNQTSETRYIREIIYGKRNRRTYWEITTDPETMPPNSTSFVMTNLQLSRGEMKKTLGNLYGLRTWVEYGFRQCKQELGWTDYRFTNFQEINNLNNLRLIIQPTILFWMIIPWLDIFPNRHLLLGFHQLISIMNQFSFHFPDG